MGEAVRERRADVLLATKVSGFRVTAGGVRRAAEGSLRRLGVEAVDLYQVHWPMPLVPVSWNMGGMRSLLEAGRIRQVGVSNYGLGRWRRAEAALRRPVVSNQVLYHLLDRSCERVLLPHAQANSRVIIAYSSLAQGLLSGRYSPDRLPRDARSGNPLFTSENVRRAQPLLDVLGEVAAAHGATPAQIALAWLVRQPNVIAIPGAKSVAQVEANAAAADMELTEDEAHALDQASAAFRPVGLNRSLRTVAWRFLSR